MDIVTEPNLLCSFQMFRSLLAQNNSISSSNTSLFYALYVANFFPLIIGFAQPSGYACLQFECASAVVVHVFVCARLPFCGHASTVLEGGRAPPSNPPEVQPALPLNKGPEIASPDRPERSSFWKRPSEKEPEKESEVARIICPAKI